MPAEHAQYDLTFLRLPVHVAWGYLLVDFTILFPQKKLKKAMTAKNEYMLGFP